MKYKGLTDSEVKASAERYGTNRLPSQPKQSFFKRFIHNLGDPIIKILLAALGINLLFMLESFDWFETFGIVLAIGIATVVTTLSEYGSEAAFEKLQAESARSFARVIRNGEIAEIPIDSLVVGDLVLLCGGEKVPADGILIDGALTADQSSLNGESIEVKKYPLRGFPDKKDLSAPNAMFRGVSVCSGEGIMEVRSVGADTMYGSLAAELQAEKRESPLKLRLNHLAGIISRIGYVAAIIVAIAYYFDALVLESAFDQTLIAAKFTSLRWQADCLLHCLTLAVTLVVVAVPEGLPMMITVVLSANMKKMLKDKILVRKLVGIETAGSLNILFTDKTGTLTTGNQSVSSVAIGGGREIAIEALDRSSAFAKELVLAVTATGEWRMANGEISGSNATDRALATAFCKSRLGNTEPNLRKKIPFDSTRKYSAAELTSGEVYIKGAPEKLLPYIENCLTEDGRRCAVANGVLAAQLHRMASGGNRIIAIAKGSSMPEGNRFSPLTLIALVAIRDRVRPDARSAVEKLRSAGIQVVMVTGDGMDTATAVAQACGIIGNYNGGSVVTGSELSAMSDAQVKTILPNLAVVARALPSDKSRLIRLSQSLDLVTGMTGDGVNDAPALKIADVGFAMGSGTEIAKEAADIVLFGDSIGYIAKAVLYGRTIFSSIRKFILFQLTMNFSAMGISLIGPFIGIDTPVTVVQMLWINIIMDTLGALAFAGEPPTNECMKEKPKKRTEPLLNRAMTGQIAFCSVMTLAICVLFLNSNRIRTIFGYAENTVYFMSAFFGLFIFLGIANCFIARTSRLDLTAHLRENKAFMLIMGLVTAIQMLMIYFGGDLFRAAPLTIGQLGMVIALAFTIVPVEIIRRIWLRMKPHTIK